MKIEVESEFTQEDFKDPVRYRYKKERIAHWERISSKMEKARRPGAFYHKLLQHYYSFLIPPGLRILELGCSHGDLLASLKPSFGVGIDFSIQMLRCAAKKYPQLLFIRADAHEIPIKEKFDVIIFSDLVNDLWDLQNVFEKLEANIHKRTRLVLNFYNNIWRIPLAIIKSLDLGADVLEQNWFSPHDIINLLEISGFEVIKHNRFVLFPLPIPLLSCLANRYLVNLPPFNWFALTNFIIARPIPLQERANPQNDFSVSVIIPARNEVGNIENILKRVPSLGKEDEIIFIEGHSTDNTYETIEKMIQRFPDKRCRLFRQSGKGKGDAVRLGFKEANGDMLIILDADMTVAPEDLPRFVEALASGKGEFINGVRLVYPMEDQAMRFFNMVGNKFFSLAFSWLLSHPIKDTLCGTKVL